MVASIRYSYLCIWAVLGEVTFFLDVRSHERMTAVLMAAAEPFADLDLLYVSSHRLVDGRIDMVDNECPRILDEM